MRVATLLSSADLAPFVQSFVVVEADVETTRVLLPDPGLVVALRYRGAADLRTAGGWRRTPDAALTGMRDSARVMRTSANGGVVVAKLAIGGPAALFDVPLHELFGTCVALDSLLPAADVAEAAARIALAGDDAARVRCFDEFLRARVRPERVDQPMVAAAQAIRGAHGVLRIGELAATSGLSRDRFEKRFRRCIGAAPKRFAAIERLHRAVALQRAGADLTRVAVEAGYFDQPHFVRAFRRFTGEAPQRFFANVAHC